MKEDGDEAAQLGFVLLGVDEERETRYPVTAMLSEALKVATVTVVEGANAGKEKAVTVGAMESTATVVVAVLVPFALVAVTVYVMVEVGFTAVAPMRVEVLKEPGVMATEEAFAMFQERVEVPADATMPDEAVKEAMVGRMPESVVPDATEDEADILPTLSWAVR